MSNENKSKKKKLKAPVFSAYLRQPDTSKLEINGEGEGVFEDIDYALSSMQGWRPGQEDAHCHFFPSKKCPGIAYFGVFDGHGGERASRYVGANVCTYIENTDAFKKEILGEGDMDPEVITEAIVEGFYACDAGMRNSALFMDGEDKSGCTGVFLAITEETIVVANTGDSRAVLVRSNIDVFSTFDQKPSHPTETERIKKAGCYIFNGRVNKDLAVARSFGDYRYKDIKLHPKDQAITVNPDMTTLYRSPNEDQLLIMACDGIWDVMSNLECSNFVLAALTLGASEQHAANLVLERCLEKGSGDNMSIIVIALENAPYQEEESFPSLNEVKRQMQKMLL